MKLTGLSIAAATIALFLMGTANAEDIKTLCVDTVTADTAAAGEESDAGAIDEACGCLADATAGNADMEANLVEIAAMAPADRDGSSSEETTAAIAVCFPQDEAE